MAALPDEMDWWAGTGWWGVRVRNLVLDVSILRSLDDSRFQGEVGTGGQHLSIFSLSVVFKAVGLDVTSWGRKVDREERGAKK